MNVLKIIFFISILYSLSFCNEVDCVILKDENSIICKYKQKRVNFEKKVKFEWIEPNGKVSRSRIINMSAGHGSVYDYRYIEGRVKGKWIFKVIDGNETYQTEFELK